MDRTRVVPFESGLAAYLDGLRFRLEEILNIYTAGWSRFTFLFFHLLSFSYSISRLYYLS